MIIRCIVCKTHRKVLCKKTCRPCYFKLYRKLKKKRHIRYGMSEYPL